MKQILIICFALIVLSLIPGISSGQIITTIAGTGTSGFTGDGGAATAARLSNPYGVIADNNGNIYIADDGNNVVRKISRNGIITTIAGNDSAGFSGDGGAATAAQLHLPGAVAVDSSGNVYVADQLNDRIRKITPSGIITTFAGNGGATYAGDGGPATAASLFRPCGVAVDTFGNVYIADQYNHRIRKVNTSGVISTIAGHSGGSFGGDGYPATAAYLYYPEGVAVDRYGNVYIADSYNNRIRKVNTSGIISTVAGNGTSGFSGDTGAATAAKLNLPYSVTVDGSGVMYIADEFNHRIRKVNASGIITTFAGTGTGAYSGDAGVATVARLDYPTGVSVDQFGNVFIADLGNNRVRKIGPAAIYVASGSTAFCVGATITLGDSTTGGTWTSSNSGVATVNTSTGVVTGISAGTATITYGISGHGNVTLGVTVNAAPTSGTISGASGACMGTSATLTSTVSGGIWGSTDTSIAWVSPYTGVVNAHVAGLDTITYSVYSSCGTAVANHNFLVQTVPAAPAAISGASTLCAGASTTYTDATAGGTWASSAPSIATVSASSGLVAGIASGTATISYVVANSCGASFASRSVSVSGSVPSVAAISTGATSVCAGGGTITLADATAGGTWTSSNPSVATISSSTGVLTGVTVGTTVITYSVTNSCGTSFATININVITAPTTPSAISGVSVLCTGATATFTDSTTGGTWSRGAAFVSIGATSGVVTGISAGTTIITYTVTNSCGSASRTTSLTVITVPATPAAITGSGSVCTGATTTMTDATTGGSWSSSSSSVASISAYGVVTGISTGTAIITYAVSNSCGASVATRTLSVITTPATPSHITGPSAFCIGTSITLTDSTTGGTWSCSGSGVVTIGASTGVVTGISAGVAVITYSISNSCGSAYITDSIRVLTAPSAPAAISGATTLCAGTTTTLTDATAGGSWSSSSTAVAVVGLHTGIVTGVSAGSVIITYSITGSCGSAYASMSMTITSVPATPAPISGPSALCVAGSATYTDTSAGGVWSCGSTGIATVSATSGIVTGIAVGSANITYTLTNSCGSSHANRSVTINPLPSVAPIAGGGVAVCPGVTTILTDSTSGGTWVSGTPSIAVVSTSGVVTGSTAGTAVITYSYSNSCGTAVATATVTVSPLPFADTIIGASNVCAGYTIILYDSTAGGGWSSSSTSIATVTASGMVTGVPTTSGTVSIFYSVSNSCGTVTVSKVITVDPAPYPGSITGTQTVCPGFTTLLHDVVTSGVWHSNDTTIATVSSTGLVTGVVLGTAIISYTLTNSCGSATTGVYVTVQPFPHAGPISGPTVVCPAKIIELTDTTNEGHWVSLDTYVASVNSIGQVTGGAPGGTYILFIAGNSCGSDTASHAVNVNPYTVCTYETGVTQVEQPEGLSVFPNPTSGTFTIHSVSQSAEAVTVLMYNIQGEQVNKFTIDPKVDKEITPNVPAGIYFLKTIIGAKTYAIRVVVTE